jgi:hypothetical protein
MLRGYVTLALLLAVVISGCTAKRHAGDLTVAELFARPREFHDKRVAVIAYYSGDFEDSALYTGPPIQLNLENAMIARSIWVEPGWRRMSRLRDHYVRVVGVFHYRPEIRREIETREDGRQFESIITEGYGHMGVYPAELANISSFRPLK